MGQSVWVAGEALIDLLPSDDEQTLRPIAGGGPANTALALARLGIETEFVGGLSNDRFGHQIAKQLAANGVGLDLAIWSDLPTCLAVVSLDEQGHAAYHFHIKSTATFDFDGSHLPNPTIDAPRVLHIGTLATAVEPGATLLLEWAKQVAKYATVVFDPNVRPSALNDVGAYRSAVQRWIDISNVVKVSDDDLRFLHPDQDPIESARRWLSPNRPLIVMTCGERGLIGVTEKEVVQVPGEEVMVVDTVGAGDTVGAVLAESLTVHAAADLKGQLLRATLARAAKAAAITCSRPGCQPPTAAELN